MSFKFTHLTVGKLQIENCGCRTDNVTKSESLQRAKEYKLKINFSTYKIADWSEHKHT